MALGSAVKQMFSGIPAAAERFSVAWKERHVRIVYAKERLRATLEAEQAVHKEYLNQYQVAQEQFLKVLLEKQLERGLAVASEAILLNQEVALQKMREQDSQWAIPAWTGLQAGMNGKRKSAHTSFN